MNEMMIFSNPEFGNVRTVTIDGDPWFVGIDVATALGYQNGSRDIQRHVEKEDKAEVPFYDGNQTRNIIAINESGLYSLIFCSKLEKAKDFKHWVTAEVLPSIRKTGKYEVGQKIDSYQISDPIKRAERWIEEQREKQLLEQKVREQKPKADYFDSLVDSKLLTTSAIQLKSFICLLNHSRNG